MLAVVRPRAEVDVAAIDASAHQPNPRQVIGVGAMRRLAPSRFVSSGSAASRSAVGACVVLLAVPAASGADSVYWSNVSSSKISFANLNGSGDGDLNTAGAAVNARPGWRWPPPQDWSTGRASWRTRFLRETEQRRRRRSGLDRRHAEPPVFPMLLQAPVGLGVPVASGGTLVGAILSCSQGAWAPDVLPSLDCRAAQNFAYG
jgi:hypothetical protein